MVYGVDAQQKQKNYFPLNLFLLFETFAFSYIFGESIGPFNHKVDKTDRVSHKNIQEI